MAGAMVGRSDAHWVAERVGVKVWRLVADWEFLWAAHWEPWLVDLTAATWDICWVDLTVDKKEHRRVVMRVAWMAGDLAVWLDGHLAVTWVDLLEVMLADQRDPHLVEWMVALLARYLAEHLVAMTDKTKADRWAE